MKSIVKLFWIIAFVAVIGFSMAACDDDSGGGGGGLSGTTWTYTESGTTFTLTFTASTVKMEYLGQALNGTYTFNGSSGTINWEDGDHESFTVNGNQLTISGYTFTKTGGGNSGGNTGGGSGGTFTLTNIPAKFNGKYATLGGSTEGGKNIWGHENNPMSTIIKNPTISNGKVILPTWDFDGKTYKGYTGNDTLNVTVIIADTSKNNGTLEDTAAMVMFYSVTFKSGSATRSYNDADSSYEY
jgi:hypothetical protein